MALGENMRAALGGECSTGEERGVGDTADAAYRDVIIGGRLQACKGVASHKGGPHQLVVAPDLPQLRIIIDIPVK